MPAGVTGPCPAVLAPQTATFATVGVVSGQVVPANPARTSLRLVNTSSNRISLGLGAAAVLDSGLTLMPGGGVWNMDQFDFTTAAIFAIAAGAGSNLSIQEFEEQAPV